MLVLIDAQLEYTDGGLARAVGDGLVTADGVHIETLAALSDRFSVVIQDTGALRRVTSNAA